MFRTFPALIVALATLQLSSVSGPLAAQEKPAPRARDARTRELHVSVLGRTGAPLTGLTRNDFVVREDGVLREVLTAARATAPLHVMLLVDDSEAADPAIADLRRGLNGFVDRLRGKGEMGLVTIGERPTSVTELTSNVDAIKKGVSRIFARPGSGAYFLEGLSDVVRGLRKREAARSHIVAVISEGVEFSNLDSQNVLDALYASRATLHVLSLGRPNDSMADEIRHRNIVIADGTDRTGGRRDQVLTPNGLPDALLRLADELNNQYVITYAVPDALIPPERVDVSVKPPGATVRARKRVQAPK